MLTQEEARASLAEWAAMVRSRDDRIRAALDAGLTKLEIAQLMDLGRSSIYRALVDKTAARGDS